MADEFITATQAAALLGISTRTFHRSVKAQLNGVRIGKRTKYSVAEVRALLSVRQENRQTVTWNIFSVGYSIADIEARPGILDITMLNEERLGPYGVLSLMSEVMGRARLGQTVELRVDGDVTCQYLRSIGFFDELSSRCRGSVTWNRDAIDKSPYQRTNNLLPIRSIKSKGGERTLAEALIQVLKTQGFTEDVRSYIGQIVGELADNAMTHSEELISERLCYFMAERFHFEEEHDCVIIGIADLGQGIHASLKTNPKYRNLQNRDAVLHAFSPFVTSWTDDAKRGKGLTDVMSIAMGNRSYFKVDSCEYSILMDFRDEDRDDITWSNPITQARGTRYALALLDKEFEPISRDDVQRAIDARQAQDDSTTQ